QADRRPPDHQRRKLARPRNLRRLRGGAAAHTGPQLRGRTRALPSGSRAPMTVTELPELVPARMLNEFAYCPRLFFLEWVDSRWAANAEVAEGERRHRRVDGGGGAVPLPGEGDLKAARSVELSSDRLGITAKLDLVEGADGGVVPVDVKKGHP